jgi:predicted metal-binding protein
MKDRKEFEQLFHQRGYGDFKWIDPRDVVIAQWVRTKCMFGCGNYGRNAACPPNVPSVAEVRQLFAEYRWAAIFHFAHAVDEPEDRHAWTRGINQELIKLERELFLAGHYKAFLLCCDSCYLCDDCSGARETCKNPRAARPSPESMAIDVFATVRKLGFPIEVLSDYSQTMNRYAFLLIE